MHVAVEQIKWLKCNMHFLNDQIREIFALIVIRDKGGKQKRGVTKKVEKTTQNLLTEQGPYNIITQCDVVRNA